MRQGVEAGLQRIPTLAFSIAIAPPVGRRLLAKLPTPHVEAAAQSQPTIITLLTVIFIVIGVQIVVTEQHALAALPLRRRYIIHGVRFNAA